MAMRHDALAAASEIILALEASAARLADAVLTVGRLVVEPNQANVIPYRVSFRIDSRCVYSNRLAALKSAIVETAERIAAARGVSVTTTLIEERRVVAMDDALRGAVATAFAEVGGPAMDLPSGAGHDAMCVASVAPAAMIFVPSVGGLSHVAAEYTSPDDCLLGVRALARSIVAIDRLVSKES
jgi:allantoate deiminase